MVEFQVNSSPIFCVYYSNDWFSRNYIIPFFLFLGSQNNRELHQTLTFLLQNHLHLMDNSRLLVRAYHTPPLVVPGLVVYLHQVLRLVYLMKRLLYTTVYLHKLKVSDIQRERKCVLSQYFTLCGQIYVRLLANGNCWVCLTINLLGYKPHVWSHVYQYPECNLHKNKIQCFFDLYLRYKMYMLLCGNFPNDSAIV